MKTNRRANGEGTIYTTIQKNKRKVFLSEQCETCKNCSKKCNRQNFEKCEKCIKCKDCLNYCDRYYCYKVTKAQITINSKRKSAGTGKNSKEVNKKKAAKTKELNKNDLIKNGDYTLSEVMRIMDKEKLEANTINYNTYNRDLCTIQLIENFNSSNKKMKELSDDDIKEIMTMLVNLGYSQSSIDKAFNEIHQACEMCNLDKQLYNNLNRNSFCSKIIPKKVEALTIEEEQQLINYINNNEQFLIKSRKSNIDNITIKNIIKFALATAMRIGEICAIKIDKDIDLEKQEFIVDNTLTRDLENKTILGQFTKTGKKKLKKNKKDERHIPFDVLFDVAEVINIIEEQKNTSKGDLLFSDKNGNFIERTSVNSIFKRICKDAGIQKDCNIHMTKHTGITRMIENGMDIYAISEIVGTSVKVLSETYAHILDDFIKKEIKKSKEKRKESNLSLDNKQPKNNVLSMEQYRNNAYKTHTKFLS